ncbi:hypothetical protein A2697_00530 [Candidatus Curtissbacteria bacterium RIFCSPHIGHO2_01_FULL_41_44]|uniref:Sortase n=1 Tax=Candidatus Curtissbacteria bacterium RIFCSPLOWO2_01_FULL_42_50 TaxID=1797730 RepID=A0A1F5H5C6_9BACT|nr:MAG: hypothetical protein A3C33_03955 [Candidatus Curtissbacteria bacterium RIFCSPHIGHO2_02_FULL_42_58]OGD93447.1 MAG: hypothetical protein A2697_00530 [Candidatus Curtissbacteria bacterium RIFCSPHIGHO2_01_FULL_41_44]OGD96708.1 MAG: hypothetical protein A3E71_01255 [Candidatus Curtissbacteria bacterium RIFCSPHIGHO2_12_FULL_42_33]OGD99363.1 MAG: hypothetical protein A3B54_04485 [Candidatus Curtissbacteria bacterium RIFCSPLOWO2_01_FULL_42_50]OGE02422.1 MAG: hypothetical protein A3G16_05260 [Ca
MKTNFLATFMIVVGASILVATSLVYLYKNFRSPQVLTESDYSDPNSTSPVKIVINDVGINVPVKVARNYQFSDNEAIFIRSTQNIGTGNSVIYAHNWDGLFGRLQKVKIGDNIAVHLANGKKVNYQISQIHTVPAETVNILKATPDSRLTLFTCTGFFDKDRLVVVAREI